MQTADVGALPLQGVRVIDLTDLRGSSCGRFLAELGADVVLVEPPGGVSSRRRSPAITAEISVSFAVHHANKRSVVIDLDTATGRDDLHALLSTADIWIDGSSPAQIAQRGIDHHTILESFPHLVIVAVTDFGLDGPTSLRPATDPVLQALAANVSRSGLSGREPLIPPGELATEAGGIQASWSAMLALWHARVTGHGDVLDVSVMEATAQILDPVFGSVGTARAGTSAVEVERGRPRNMMYPIYRCRDGFVRIVILAARQWQAVLEWLGTPATLSDPELASVAGRTQRFAEVYAAVAALVADLDVSTIVAEGQRRGVPVAPVMTVAETLAAEHYRVRQAIVETELAPAVTAAVPNGMVVLDGVRAGVRVRAPLPGEDTDDVLRAARGAPARTRPTLGPRAEPPLRGLRVLDFGVIVMGAEASRMFADQGAEVIKVENRNFPDGFRASIQGKMSLPFAAGHRNKLAVGLDLRTHEGVELVKRLVGQCDVVLENFKPGTLDALGLGWDVLRAMNPRLVMVSSSAMGADGPWSSWMGYGPLVRCTTALTSLWRYRDDDSSFSDGTTIFPDHFAARVASTAALAAVLRARETGTGNHLDLAQAETILWTLADLLVRRSVEPDNDVVGEMADDHPWGCYPCAGDDEWCVITVRHDHDWQMLTSVLGMPPDAHRFANALGRREHRVELDEWLASKTSTRSNRALVEELADVGVPGAPMYRPIELLDDPQLVARGFFGTLDQPFLDAPVTVENGPYHALRLPEPELRPAPLLGQHTRQVCRDLLGLDESAIDQLFAADVLQEDSP